jgi:Mg2+ and Co2+ transporter CorA
MNTHVPGEGGAEGFWVVVGLMVLLGITLLGVFRWRRWL